MSQLTHYKIRRLSPRKTNVETYVFHPEIGPKGTPGRGPYCQGWHPIKVSQIPEAERQAKAAGLSVLPEEGVTS